MTDDPWVMNLITMASGPHTPARDAAIRALYYKGWLVEDINTVCSVDLAVVRWAILHAPVVRTEE